MELAFEERKREGDIDGVDTSSSEEENSSSDENKTSSSDENNSSDSD